MNQETTAEVEAPVEEQSAEVEATPAPEETSSSASSDEWEGFVDEFDSDDEVREEAEVEAPQAAEKPETTSDDDGKGEETKAPEQPVAEEPQEPVEAVVEEVQPPETPVAEEAPQAKEETPQELSAEQKAEMRESALNVLSEQYQLEQSEDLDFETNLTQNLPKLAANLHLSVYEQVVQSVMSSLPQVVGGLITSQQTAQKREQEFFSEYEDLAPYKEQVTQVASMWSQMNAGKQLSPEKRRAEIARFARAAIGITPAPPQAPVEVPSSAPPPQAPPVQSNYAQQKNLTPWEQMAIELENDPDNY